MSDEPKSDPAVIPVSGDVGIRAAELFFELERLCAAVPVSGTDERNRLIRILKAFADFVGQAWLEPAGPRSVRFYLWSVASAIEQLNDGTVHPMLKRKMRRGRKNDHSAIWLARMNACLALYCYERDGRGKSRNELSDWIARKQPTLKKLIRVGTGKTRGGLADAIKSWYRGFQQGTAHEIVQGSWQCSLKEIEDYCQGDPARYAEMAEAHLSTAIKMVAGLLPQGNTRDFNSRN
jgi:hypothetical protein